MRIFEKFPHSQVIIVKSRSSGVEVFNIYIGSTYVCQRLSLQGPGSAMDVAKKFCKEGMSVWHEIEKFVVLVSKK